MKNVSPLFYKPYCGMSKWQQALCHMLPAMVALFIGAFAIMAVDRNLPQEVTWGKIIPPDVVPGQPVTFHFGLRKHVEYGGSVTRWVTDVHGQVFKLIDSPVVNDQLKANAPEVEITKTFTVPCGMAVGAAEYHSITYLHSWWNLVQWVFPVSHEVTYPFNVKNGSYDGVCASSSNVGTQGMQGIQGVPGTPAELLPRPRVIHKVWIEPTMMVPGGKFVVNFDVTLNQICPGEVHWSVVRTSDGVEVSKIVQPTVAAQIGRHQYSNTWMLPNNVQPGEYYYTATVYEFCGPDRTTYMATTEHIPFEVR